VIEEGVRLDLSGVVVAEIGAGYLDSSLDVVVELGKLLGRNPQFLVHFPDVRRLLHTEGSRWRLVTAEGATIKSGNLP
jgi:hypothetical protein